MILRRDWERACALARSSPRNIRLGWYEFLCAAGRFQRVRKSRCHCHLGKLEPDEIEAMPEDAVVHSFAWGDRSRK